VSATYVTETTTSSIEVDLRNRGGERVLAFTLDVVDSTQTPKRDSVEYSLDFVQLPIGAPLRGIDPGGSRHVSIPYPTHAGELRSLPQVELTAVIFENTDALGVPERVNAVFKRRDDNRKAFEEARTAALTLRAAKPNLTFTELISAVQGFRSAHATAVSMRLVVDEMRNLATTESTTPRSAYDLTLQAIESSRERAAQGGPKLSR
jgi:hypothetical protein